MAIVWQSGPAVVSGGLLCRIVGALVPLAMLSVSKRILDGIQIHFAGKPLPAGFWLFVAGEFGLAAFGAILGRTTWYFDSLLADRFTRHVSIRVMEHASRLDLASYEDPFFYDKLERARAQATDRIAMIQVIGSIIHQTIGAISLSALIFWFSPWLLVVLVAAVVPAFLGESHFAFLGYSLNLRQTPARRQLDYLRVLGASKESAKELKLFGLGGFLTDEYTRLSNQIYDQNVHLVRRRLWAGAALSLLSTAGYYGSYAYVIYRTVNGGISWGTLQLLAGAIGGASSNLQNIFSAFSSVADHSLFLTDLVEFFRVKPKIASKPGALPAPRPIRDGFLFDKVSFSYPGRERCVLDHFDFRIEPGERVALIGENGEGKTTVVKLMTRLYDPTGGRILLDGTDLREYSMEDLHSQIGVIFQDFMRYEMSAWQNIAVGRIELAQNGRAHDQNGRAHGGAQDQNGWAHHQNGNVPDQNGWAQANLQDCPVQRAAIKSLADQVVRNLPNGYDQLLGRRFEGGVDLSGGEWQKIALARAYLRQAQLLILDEPTASLDARSEYEVFQRFADLTQGKMALLISHRFSTVRMADRIAVLQHGVIAEQGSHDQLIALGRLYASMFELQAASYR